jgi:hypothetical protein
MRRSVAVVDKSSRTDHPTQIHPFAGVENAHLLEKGVRQLRQISAERDMAAGANGFPATKGGILHPYVSKLAPVARLLDCDPDLVAELVEDLRRSELVYNLQAQCEGVPEFSSARFQDIDAFSLFRTFLYVLVRLKRPGVFCETGVLNGFSSAFILQAMAHNGSGKLVSIDLPSRDLKLLDQGTADLPAGKEPAWAIPDSLRGRHELRLGRAERLLPEYILANGAPDIFMHDSDHSWPHVMMEISLVWAHMREGLVIVDNTEINDAAPLFAKSAGARYLEVASWDDAARKWRHGLLVKTAA